MARVARGPAIQRIAADEGEIDQGRHAQAHVVDPDQHAQPVIGKQARKGQKTPQAEILLWQGDLRAGREERADRAILIVPGRIG